MKHDRHARRALHNDNLVLTFADGTGDLRGVVLDDGATELSTGAEPASIAIRTNGSQGYLRSFEMNASDIGAREQVPVVRTAQFSVIDAGDAHVARVEQESDAWVVRTSYTLDVRDPLVKIDFEVEYRGDEPGTLDGIVWRSPPFMLSKQPRPDWADVRGAFVNVFETDSGCLIAAWRIGEGDGAEIELEENRIVAHLRMGGRLSGGKIFAGGTFCFLFAKGLTVSALSALPSMLMRHGLVGRGPYAEWIRDVQVYETFIGSWPMDGTGNAYAPYPCVDDLISDLGRIRSLGFDAIYLMPRHPYPSYSVASLTDLDLQYGDGGAGGTSIRTLVSSAHHEGLKVLLDVILHGVLDHSSVDEQIRRQEHFDARDLRPPTGSEIADYNDRVVSGEMFEHWINYEHAHEASWRTSAPKIHPYWREHPEWFTKRKDGTGQYTYTRSFDLRDPSFQMFFRNALAQCMSEWHVDGFRFDAPFWTNRQWDWDEDRGYRASWASGGAIELLASARETLSERHPHVCIYVESMDANITKTAHLQYTYDTYWGVIDRLGRKTISADLARRRLGFIRFTRAPGVADVNVVDSHDTCWWYREGHKRARERYGIGRTRLLYALVALLDGGIQMFSGGEKEIEPWLVDFLKIRRNLSVLREGRCDVINVSCDEIDVFPVLRFTGDQWLLALLNFGSVSRRCSVGMPHEVRPGGGIQSIYAGDWQLGPAPAMSGGTVTVNVPEASVVIVADERSIADIGRITTDVRRQKTI